MNPPTATPMTSSSVTRIRLRIRMPESLCQFVQQCVVRRHVGCPVLPQCRLVMQGWVQVAIARSLVHVQDADRDMVAPFQRLGKGRLAVGRVVVVRKFLNTLPVPAKRVDLVEGYTLLQHVDEGEPVVSYGGAHGGSHMFGVSRECPCDKGAIQCHRSCQRTEGLQYDAQCLSNGCRTHRGRRRRLPLSLIHI